MWCMQGSNGGTRTAELWDLTELVIGACIECGYRVDLVVQDHVIVELKCVERLLSIHEAQVITYLKLIGLEVGLLVNFHTVRLRDGIRRVTVPRH